VGSSPARRVNVYEHVFYAAEGLSRHRSKQSVIIDSVRKSVVHTLYNYHGERIGVPKDPSEPPSVSYANKD